MEYALNIVRLLAYIWVFIELVTLSNFYYYAHSKMGKSPIIKAVADLLAAFAFLTICRFLLSYAVILLPHTHWLLKNGIIFPLLVVGFFTRRFRMVSLDNTNVKELKEVKKVEK